MELHELNFRIIKEYPNYMVSDNGIIKNCKTGRFLKPCINPNGYFYINLCINGKRKTHLIHKLVAEAFINNPDNKKEIDHIDNNKLNNSVKNLRYCTHQENNANKPKKINNTTGVVGVIKNGNNYKSQISFNGKYYYLGTFKTLEEAALKRIEAEKLYFGEYRNTYNENFTENLKIDDSYKSD